MRKIRINSKSLEYKVNNPTGYKYGYLLWPKEELSKITEFFPENPFTVEINDRTLSNRKFERTRCRINLYPARDVIKKGDVLLIEREKEKVVITKK